MAMTRLNSSYSSIEIIWINWRSKSIFGTEPFTCIADGGTVGSSIEIIYNVATTPSVIYINELGIIDKITEGVTEYIESFLANKM